MRDYRLNRRPVDRNSRIGPAGGGAHARTRAPRRRMGSLDANSGSAAGRTPQEGAILKRYTPASWFDPRGIHKVLKRFIHRIPNLDGKLFLTLTIDPKLFLNEGNAFDHSRQKIRKLFYRLRKGIEWNGKLIQIDAPYAVKVEFHENGFAHFHVVFLTRRHLPADLLNHLWDLGRTNVKRIKNDEFHYLLKYVTKSGEIPEWVLQRKSLRIWQTSRGFLLPKPETESEEAPTESEDVEPREEEEHEKEPNKQERSTIGERLEAWSRKALLIVGDQFRAIELTKPFRELFDHEVWSLALNGCYFGSSSIIINETKDIISWISKTSLLKLRRLLP